MKKLITNTLLLGIITLLFSGCTYRVLDFTVVSSKNVDFSKADTFERGNTRVEGQDRIHWIVIIPTGQVNIKEAIDRAIESTPGCVALLDGVIYSKYWYLPFVYGQQTVTIEGTPLIDPSFVFNSEEIPSFGKLELDKNGEIKRAEYVTPTEYFVLKNKIAKESREIHFKNSVEL